MAPEDFTTICDTANTLNSWSLKSTPALGSSTAPDLFSPPICNQPLLKNFAHISSLCASSFCSIYVFLLHSPMKGTWLKNWKKKPNKNLAPTNHSFAFFWLPLKQQNVRCYFIHSEVVFSLFCTATLEDNSWIPGVMFQWTHHKAENITTGLTCWSH